jgi:hypothetical protein
MKPYPKMRQRQYRALLWPNLNSRLEARDPRSRRPSVRSGPVPSMVQGGERPLHFLQTAKLLPKFNSKKIQVRRPLALNYGKNTPTNQLLVRFLGPDEKNFFSELKFLAFSVIILWALWLCLAIFSWNRGIILPSRSRYL